MHTHYKLQNGDLISKARVDNAKALIALLDNGYEMVNLTDEELFSKGDKFDAVLRFREKHDCSLSEAHAEITHLRNGN